MDPEVAPMAGDEPQHQRAGRQAIKHERHHAAGHALLGDRHHQDDEQPGNDDNMHIGAMSPYRVESAASLPHN